MRCAIYVRHDSENLPSTLDAQVGEARKWIALRGWIVDDARGFTERETRRDRRYAGVVLDPPTYGHGAGGRAWRIESDLEPLLAGCRQLMEPGGFVLLTAHTPSLGPDDLGATLVRSMRLPREAVEVGELGLTATDGRRLELGAFARADGTA